MRVLGPTGKWVDIFTGLSPSLRKFPHNETEAYCVNPILLLVNGVALFYSGKYFGLPEKIDLSLAKLPVKRCLFRQRRKQPTTWRMRLYRV